jgi:hypothetical protein
LHRKGSFVGKFFFFVVLKLVRVVAREEGHFLGEQATTLALGVEKQMTVEGRSNRKLPNGHHHQ